MHHGGEITHNMEMLFLRRRGRFAGGHLKLRDYLEHTATSGIYRPILCLSGQYDATVPGTDYFANLACLKLDHPRPAQAYFIAGEDWRMLDDAGIDVTGKPIVNLIQGFRHVEPGSFLRACLARPATRICVSTALADVIRPLANGPIHIAPTAISPPMAKNCNSATTDIFIAGLKNPILAKDIFARLSGAWRIDLATEHLPRVEYLERIARARVVVLLPMRQEGFFLPPLEAMHLNAATVTCDCLGLRDYCIDNVNCLLAPFDPDAIAAAAHRLLEDGILRGKIVAGGRATIGVRTIDKEQIAYLDLLSVMARSQRPDTAHPMLHLAQSAHTESRAERVSKS